jgi:hypothetical protein
LYGIVAYKDSAIALDAILHWKQRVSIRGRLGGECGAHGPAGARTVVHHHLLIPNPAEPFGNLAGDDVGRARGRKGYDVAHRFGRVTLSGRGPWEIRCHSGQREECAKKYMAFVQFVHQSNGQLCQIAPGARRGQRQMAMAAKKSRRGDL